MLVGTPEDLIKEIVQFQTHSVGFGTSLLFANNYAYWEATKRSYELAACYVFPYFQHTNSLRRESFAEAKIQYQELQFNYMTVVETASMNYQTPES